jgi:hypothetical protein
MPIVERFLNEPYVHDLLVACFSEGKNLLKVILNIEDENDQDGTSDEESTHNSSASQSSAKPIIPKSSKSKVIAKPASQT